MNRPALPVQQKDIPSDSLGLVPGARYHHLDAVRAFALLLGVFFHAAESFGPNNHYWAIVDRSPSEFLEYVRFACHSFRMELFFIIAGFFARFMLLRRGTGGFVTNRFQRVLVPFVVGWLLLYPMLVAIWLWGASVTGRLAEFGVPAEALSFPVWKLTLGFFLTGGFIEKFDLTHLWFLHQLLIIYALALAVNWMALRFEASGRMMERVDNWFARICAGRTTFYLFLLPTVPILLLMRGWGVDTPKTSLLPHLPTTLLFGYCFLLGWLWHRQPGLLTPIAARWPWYIGLGMLVWLVFGLTFGKTHWNRLPYTIVYAHMMWGFILGFLGLFTRFFQRANRWTRYVADASYWIYIVHLPLVVALQVLIGRLAVPWPIKYPLLCAVVLLLVFLTYHYFVRATFIGVQLNGRRYPRQWPWQQ